ncbi:MAG: ribosomal protein L29 [Candidatus Saccharimonadales bacterium]|jgi:ribosomal protein L29
MSKIEEIRNMDTTKLVTASTALRDEIAEIRRRVHMGEMQNTRTLRMKKRELARMLTVLTEQLSKENA